MLGLTIKIELAVKSDFDLPTYPPNIFFALILLILWILFILANFYLKKLKKTMKMTWLNMGFVLILSPAQAKPNWTEQLGSSC